MGFVRILFILSMVISINTLQGQSFKDAQQKYPRFREAYKSKLGFWQDKFKEKGLEYHSFDLFLRAFKQEQLLEVWVKKKNGNKYQLLHTYPFCTSSGTLGPKRKQGDRQIPEGIYHIDRFNPASNFHLSLGINYPNASDKAFSGRNNPGGDIFIHGNCVTIGCIPITNDKIKELYILAVEARTNGQKKIPVHIFPFKMSEKNMAPALSNNRWSTDTKSLWKNLKPIFEDFEKSNGIGAISIGAKGEYMIK